MDARLFRASAVAILAAVLSAAWPMTALADPGTVDPSVKVIVDGSGTTVSASGAVQATGTSAGVNVPATTVTVGSGGASVTAPDLSGASTGSGPASAGVTAPATHTASATVDHSVGGSGIAAASSGIGAAAGTSPQISANDPATRSSVNAGAQANAVLCLLANIVADPARATLSSLCGRDASTAGGGGQLDASNGIAGAAVSTDGAARAALCLLGTAGSSGPSHLSTDDVASAALSTLCGGAPSTASVTGGTTVTSDRTGTSVSTAPAVDAAACLLANGIAGTRTAIELATMCGSLSSTTTPSGGTAVVPVIARDGTTGSGVDLAPAANAAACVLANALANIPGNVADASASATLSTACASNGIPSPSGAAAQAPASGDVSGTGVDLAPAANAALCVLANANVAASGQSASLVDACTSAAPGSTAPGGGTQPSGAATQPGGTGTTSGGAGAGERENAQVPAPLPLPAGGTAQAGAAAGTTGTSPANGAVAGTNAGVTIAGLPSTATAGGGALLLALVAAAALLTLRRKRA